MTDFRNASGLEFTNISSERKRIYQFPNGQTYCILTPKMLHISKSGGHRIFDGDTCHYIQPSEGWAVSWQVQVGAPHFVK